MNTFQNLIVWQKSHELVLKIYEATKNFPKEEIYGVTNQIRRASCSIPANIAEGRKKKTQKHKISFLSHSEGSLEEVKYFLILSKDLQYISNEIFLQLFNCAEEIGKLINGYEKFLKQNNKPSPL